MHHLADHGWVCVAINYRLSPKATWPDHLVDCKLALKWVREHIGEYGGDPAYVVVTGGSAGGRLAAMVGLTTNRPEFQPGFEDLDTSVRAVVPFYGVFDFLDRHGFRGASSASFRRMAQRHILKAHPVRQREMFERASPFDQIRRDAPPMLVVHGDLDVLAPVEEARLFAERLAIQRRARRVRRTRWGAACVRDVPLDPCPARGIRRGRVLGVAAQPRRQVDQGRDRGGGAGRRHASDQIGECERLSVPRRFTRASSRAAHRCPTFGTARRRPRRPRRTRRGDFRRDGPSPTRPARATPCAHRGPAGRCCRHRRARSERGHAGRVARSPTVAKNKMTSKTGARIPGMLPV